jgi:ATPase family AAA domain-containing protein 3A/B
MSQKYIVFLLCFFIGFVQGRDPEEKSPTGGLSAEDLKNIENTMAGSISRGLSDAVPVIYKQIKEMEQKAVEAKRNGSDNKSWESEQQQMREQKKHAQRKAEFEEQLRDENAADDFEKEKKRLDKRHATDMESKKYELGLREEIKELERQGRDSNATKDVESGTDSLLEGLKNAMEEGGPKLSSAFRSAVGSVLNLQNVVQYGGLVGMSFGVPVVGYYVFKTAGRWFEEYVLSKKPQVLTEGSKFGSWDRFKRKWNKYQMPELILHSEVRAVLTDIVQEAIIIKQRIKQGAEIFFSNILFWGPPGTGKTMFVQALADFTNMDFAPTTAGNLLQPNAGIALINELFERANKSKYGVIIFIDEADALFVDRNQLNPDSDLYRVLNHLLALIGSGSKKVMIVAATNHRHVLDEAMDRRFQKIIHMPLPDEATRKAIIHLYIKKVLLSPKNNSAPFIGMAKKLMSDAVVNAIAKATEGLSNAELANMVQDMNKKGLITKNGMITGQNIQAAVDDAVDKRKKANEAKTQREEHFSRLAARKAGTSGVSAVVSTTSDSHAEAAPAA